MKIRHRVSAAGIVVSCAFAAGGCSSVMSHTGGDQGYYSGTHANNEILEDHNTRWPIKTLAVVDYPFSAVMDTLLVPLDYFRAGRNPADNSLHARVLQSETLAKTEDMPTDPVLATRKNPSP